MRGLQSLLRSVLAGQDSHEISMSASHSDFPRLVRQVSLVEKILFTLLTTMSDLASKHELVWSSFAPNFAAY